MQTHARSVARVAFAALAGLGLTVSAATAQTDLTSSEREIMYESIKPGVVFVTTSVEAQIQVPIGNQVVEWTESTGGSGSGWLITPDGYLVTNGHVVELYHADNEAGLKGQLFYQGFQRNYLPALRNELGREPTQEEWLPAYYELYNEATIALTKQLAVFTQNWRRYNARVAEYSAPISPTPDKFSYPGYELKPGKDVAILKIDGRDFPSVAVGNYDDVRMGQDVFPAGYPGVVFSHDYLSRETLLEISINSGTVSSLKLTNQGSDVMQMDADVTWGNSGGPVFNQNGEVVAMSTFISIAQDLGQSQAISGFNFAVPVSTIMEFVRSAGVTPNRDGLFNQTWDRGITAYATGDWEEAIAEFNRALELMPGLPVAEQLRRRARTALDQAPPGGGGMPGWLLPVGGIVLLGLLLLVAGARMNRKPAMATAGATAHGPAAVEGGATAGMIPSKGSGTLVVREGPLQGNRFPVGKSGVKIGRDPSTCQIVLSESTVSREHAIIANGPNGDLQVRNLSGTNPTYVNDRAIQESQLRAGDRIKIGDSVIQYENA